MKLTKENVIAIFSSVDMGAPARVVFDMLVEKAFQSRPMSKYAALIANIQSLTKENRLIQALKELRTVASGDPYVASYILETIKTHGAVDVRHGAGLLECKKFVELVRDGKVK